MTAFMPEPHILLTVVAATPLGKPAASAAWRAGACPSPAGSTQPIKTSLTCAASTPARCSAALMAALPSCGALSAAKLPWNAPIGVRAMPTMTMGSSAVAVMSLLCPSGVGNCLLPRSNRWSRPWARPAAAIAAPIAATWPALGRLFEQLAADQPAADLAGAGADFVEFGVAQQAARREIIDVTVATEELYRIERDLRRLFGGI